MDGVIVMSPIGLRTPDLRPGVWLYGQRDLAGFQFNLKWEDSIFGGVGGTGTGVDRIDRSWPVNQKGFILNTPITLWPFLLKTGPEWTLTNDF